MIRFFQIRTMLLSILMIVPTIMAAGAGPREITGEATYYDDGSLSRIECMKRAAEQARIDALAKAFGTIISQDIVQADRVSSGRETNEFLSLSTTEVKGEWLGDVEEPQYEFSRDANENLIVTCRVRGNAREISNQGVPFEALVLRNGEKEVHASTSFRDGDEMRVLFNGAADGYVCVFLQDETGTVYGLLPYPRDAKSEVKVKKDRKYVFFKGGDKEFGPSEELIMTAGDEPEFNRLFVVFSPNAFTRPVMSANGSGLPSVSAKEFTKWLLRVRRNDQRMGVKAVNIRIDPKS